jgi:hypothetical protein
MASSVELCNLALAKIRAKSINSLNGSSIEAQQCNLHYNLARDQVLADHDWGFNTRVIALAQYSSSNIFNWPYMWAYPSDCLHLNYLIRNITEASEDTSNSSAVALRFEDDHRQHRPSVDPPVEYDVFFDQSQGNKVIGTKESGLRANYRAQIDDPNVYTTDFKLALSYLLGSMIAVPIVGEERGSKLEVRCLQLYSAFIDKAKTKANNQKHYRQKESEYIRVRRGG